MNKERSKQFLKGEHCIASIKNLNKLTSKMMTYYKQSEINYDFIKLDESLTKLVNDMNDIIINFEEEIIKKEKAEEEEEERQIKLEERQRNRHGKKNKKTV